MIALALVDVGVVLTDVDTLVSCTPTVFTSAFLYFDKGFAAQHKSDSSTTALANKVCNSSAFRFTCWYCLFSSM